MIFDVWNLASAARTMQRIMIFWGCRCCGEVEVEAETEAEVDVNSALRASLCGGPPRVEDPTSLLLPLVAADFVFGMALRPTDRPTDRPWSNSVVQHSVMLPPLPSS